MITIDPTKLPTASEIAIANIRAVENRPEVADAMRRAARLAAIEYAIDLVIRRGAEKGLTVSRAQAHVWSMANDSDYTTLYNAEQEIKPIREQLE